MENTADNNIGISLLQINHVQPNLVSRNSTWISARLRSSLILLIADIISFMTSALLSLCVRVIFGDRWRMDLFPQVIPVVIVCLIFYSLFGLYPALGLSATEELRRLVTTTSLVVLAFAALSFWIRNADAYSRLTLTLTWMFSLFLLPLGRDLMRSIGLRLQIWGEPVTIIGYGKQGQWAVDFFVRNRQLGLNPVAVIDFSGNGFKNTDLQLIKTGDSSSTGDRLGGFTGTKTAMIIASDVPANFLNHLANNKQGGFERLIVIPNLEQISSYGIMAFDFGGVIGLEVRHNLLNRNQRALKRAMDIVLVIFGGILISPFLLLIAGLIKLESHSDPFFRHDRIGKGGRQFKALKFCTMVPNADEKLKEFLANNPELQKEWEATHKLKNDPRVTRLGTLLRRFSIDELPQLWNVLKGDMSLVGPRPIVLDEIQHYGDRFDPYTWVIPGMTGLWQISGRNDTSYEERVSLDEYYVRNWSIWLDVYILARTLWIVLQQNGAY